MNNELISLKLYEKLLKNGYEKQVDKIFEVGWGDIGPEFLGFLQPYFYLSKFISTERTIIDLGCAYGFQSYYFRAHKKYVGVDHRNKPFLQTENSQYFSMDIEEFIKHELTKFKNTFAICNFVPCKDSTKKLIKEAFEDLFIFYVSDDDLREITIDVKGEMNASRSS